MPQHGPAKLLIDIPENKGKGGDMKRLSSQHSPEMRYETEEQAEATDPCGSFRVLVELMNARLSRSCIFGLVYFGLCVQSETYVLSIAFCFAFYLGWNNAAKALEALNCRHRALYNPVEQQRAEKAA